MLDLYFCVFRFPDECNSVKNGTHKESACSLIDISKQCMNVTFLAVEFVD